MSITVETIKRLFDVEETYFKVSDTGNIGIGTTTPQKKFEIFNNRFK